MVPNNKREYIKRRYLLMKVKAVNHKGGKCIKCGYNNCVAAMIFHHRDPKTKDFDWSHLRKQSWKRIIEELDKCDLLCCRCHSEIHYDKSILEEAVQWMAEKKHTTKGTKVSGEIGYCKYCNKSFVRTKWDKNKKYCSRECVRLSQERVKWPNHDELLEIVTKLGMVKVGKNLGVSPRAVKKRLDRCGGSPGFRPQLIQIKSLEQSLDLLATRK